ncbi:MAG: hypothetical protein QOK08_2439 [Actinomycetota bacterium]|nr:hypothetical protein [Actinomycetota bacterium]
MDAGADEWVRFNAERRWVRVISSAGAPTGISNWGEFFVVILVAILFGVFRLLLPSPQVNVVQQRIRVGWKSFAFGDIGTARLDVVRYFRSRDLWLRFGPRRGPQLVVKLTDREARLLDPSKRELLIEILTASSLPQGPHTTSSLTRSQAIDLVRRPPGPRERLPR